MRASRILNKFTLLNIALFLGFTIVVFLNSIITQSQHYSYTAYSILEGNLYLPDITPRMDLITDTMEYNGQRYFTLAPFPAFLLVPFVATKLVLGGQIFQQGALNLVIFTAVFYICKNLALKKGYETRDALYLALAFCFTTPFFVLGSIPWSWYFTQIIAVLLMFLSIWEFYGKKRYFLIGILFGMIFMSRFTAGFAGIFFVLNIIFEPKKELKYKAIELAKLGIPIIISGILLLLYNYVRFEDVWNNGYKFLAINQYYTEFGLDEKASLFDIRYIPRNFYYYFLKPTLGFPGIGFFYLSPVFLYILKIFKKKTYAKNTREINHVSITVAVVLFSLLAYYWPGFIQIGPRYILDILPFVYLLLLESFKDHKLPKLAKVLIVVSFVVNAILIFHTYVFV